MAQFKMSGIQQQNSDATLIEKVWNYIKPKVLNLIKTNVPEIDVPVTDVQADGTSVVDENGVAQIDLSSKVNKSGDTITGSISRESGGQWIAGRDNATVKQTKHTTSSGSSWNPVASVKTANGNWTIGNVGNDGLEFSYDTDANYSSKNNSSNVITLDGTYGGTIWHSGNYPSYTSSETSQGRWVDGKPIYRKIIRHTNSGQSFGVGLGLSNVGNIIELMCYIEVPYNKSQNVNTTGYWYASSDFMRWYLYPMTTYPAGMLQVDGGSSWPKTGYTLIIDIQYTKR